MSQKDFKNFIDISIFIQSSISIKIKKIACRTINFLYNCIVILSLYTFWILYIDIKLKKYLIDILIEYLWNLVIFPCTDSVDGAGTSSVIFFLNIHGMQWFYIMNMNEFIYHYWLHMIIHTSELVPMRQSAAEGTRFWNVTATLLLLKEL